MRPFGVYIHVPWCRSRCPYCDFAIAVAEPDDVPHERYLAAVLAELAERAPQFEGRALQSIYLGGGTPSLWRSDCIAAALDAVRSTFAAGDADLEITLEANPTDCTADVMAAWRAAGINRLSIGVQSTDDGELATLGRDHRMGDGLAALARSLDAGFATLSADIILGTPGGRGTEAVERIAAAGPPHLSVYELTIEERTPLAAQVRRGELTVRDDDELAELYESAHQLLCDRGYEHYEVSSYARPGHRARHNSLYWRGSEFLGVGNGAASFSLAADGGGKRWTNRRSVGAYLAAGGEDRVEIVETLSAAEVAADRLWLGLRTSDGVEAAAFAGRERLLDWLLAADLARSEGGRIKPTLRGFLYADEVARRAVSS